MLRQSVASLPEELLQLLPSLCRYSTPIVYNTAPARLICPATCNSSQALRAASNPATYPLSPLPLNTWRNTLRNLGGGSRKTAPYKPLSRGFCSTSPRHSTATPQFTYKIAASYSGKGQKLDPERNVFKFDPFSRLQPMTVDKDAKGKKRQRASGQDAFFVSRVNETGAVAFGVADGVGGWADQGIDSADFAHGLCNYMADAAYDFAADSEKDLSAKELLTRGFHDVCQDEAIGGGGSTACVAIGRPDGSLEVANLGDSGFIQMRLNAVHHYSNPQTHAFNTPYQLSRVPPKILAQIAHFGGSIPFGDLPDDAGVTHHKLRHGDVLVFATDGVWDNLSSQDALSVISRKMTESGGWLDSGQGMEASKDLAKLTREDSSGPSSNSLQAALAVAVTSGAKAASVNTKVDGPFARAVQQRYPSENYRGGKVDDICVVVAVVLEAQ